MQAIDYTGEIQPASDTLGLKVIGRCEAQVDNTVDGHTSNAKCGIFRYANSSTYALTRANIGRPCYVENDQTVGAGSTYYVPAGIVVDVDSSGVWVDQSPLALAAARAAAIPYVSAQTGTTATVTAAMAFQGNVVMTASNSGATVITLPSAVPGYRIGIQRVNAGAGYDVTITPGSADTVRGGTTVQSAVNTTDAISQVLWIETINDTAWVDAGPLAGDRSVWVATS
jgi:hypothetical protein